MTRSPVLQTIGLSKHYGAVKAVNEVDLHVEQGEIYAFLGRNGAGKTTTIRMLLGLIHPTAGQVRLFGEEIREGGRGPWHRVGYLVERPAAYPELTVRENLEVVRRLRKVRAPESVNRAIERFGLRPYAHRRAGTLSMGNLQRLGLAQALLHNPELVVLDELTNALDPAGVVEVRELLRSLAQEEGLTVFMSSHLLAEVALLATRIGILHEGRLVEELDAAALARRSRYLCVRVRASEEARVTLAAAGYTVALRPDSGALVLSDAHAVEAPEEVARLLVMAHTPPLHLAVEQEDLETHFLHLTEEER